MGQRAWRMNPFESVVRQWKRREKWRPSSEWIHRRSKVMEKAGQSEFESSRGASRLRLGFENVHLQPSLRENNGRRKPIGTGADDASSAYQFRFSLHLSGHRDANHCRGASEFGHWTTAILPSGSRSSVGAYNPSNSRRHHRFCVRFSTGVVNQYCQITARTWRGGL